MSLNEKDLLRPKEFQKNGALYKKAYS